MNRRQALNQARHLLENGGVEDAGLEGEILLRHILGADRAALFSDLESELPPPQYKELLLLVERRRSGEPSAYITGKREFYGRGFIVDNHVLIPRPETELLVEKALELIQNNGVKSIADIGTGCGCIAISLAKQCPGIKLYATDISPTALETARQNSTVHGVVDRITFLTGDLLAPLPEPIDLIAANLPYVKSRDITTNFEPRIALDGGKDGLDKIRELLEQLPGKITASGFLLLEIGQGQSGILADDIKNRFPDGAVQVIKDLAGIDRVLVLRLTA